MKNKIDKIKLAPGKYVLAVSGGVDSMVLLDLLSRRADIELVVVHFNHGIRGDSTEDEMLVGKTAKALGLVLETGYGELGSQSSEEQARMARYNFLEGISKKYQADAIITAHHQDDHIETVLINVLRGSGRRGVTAITDNPMVIRPLIKISKSEILNYAKTHRIEWREDSTNKNLNYLRNYLRIQVLPNLLLAERSKLLKNIDNVAKNKIELDELIATLSHSVKNQADIDRSKFSMLPSELASELITFWLREEQMRQFNRKTIDRLMLALKTGRPKTEVNVDKNLKLIVGTTSAHFRNR